MRWRNSGLKKARGKLTFIQLIFQLFHTDQSCDPLLAGSGIAEHFDLCEQLRHGCLWRGDVRFDVKPMKFSVL